MRVPDPYNGPKTPVIDVSFYQGHSINWAAVRQSGARGVISRIGQGTGKDSTFIGNQHGTRSEGMRAGSYQYFLAGHDPLEQAKVACDQLHVGGFTTKDLPPACDIERSDGTDDPHRIADAMLAAREYIERQLACRTMAYAGAFFAAMVETVEPPIAEVVEIAKRPLWTPCYTHVPVICKAWIGHGGWSLWQYTDGIPVPGIEGHKVDHSWFRGDDAAFAAFTAAPTG
jgi:GH25 family lysozyme M1 (1,4-beta-N-acetylmuramidase)